MSNNMTRLLLVAGFTAKSVATSASSSVHHGQIGVEVPPDEDDNQDQPRTAVQGEQQIFSSSSGGEGYYFRLPDGGDHFGSDEPDFLTREYYELNPAG